MDPRGLEWAKTPAQGAHDGSQTSPRTQIPDRLLTATRAALRSSAKSSWFSDAPKASGVAPPLAGTLPIIIDGAMPLFLSQFGIARKMIGREHLSLDNGEIDLNLVV